VNIGQGDDLPTGEADMSCRVCRVCAIFRHTTASNTEVCAPTFWATWKANCVGHVCKTSFSKPPGQGEKSLRPEATVVDE
jgi:hypothetical protein